MNGRKAPSNGIEPRPHLRSAHAVGSPDRRAATCLKASTGIIDPNTGLPVGSNDPYFREVNAELSDKGFFVAATDDLITWARTGSLMWMTFGFGVLRGRNDAGLDAAL